jgi:hypothetical protein
MRISWNTLHVTALTDNYQDFSLCLPGSCLTPRRYIPADRSVRSSTVRTSCLTAYIESNERHWVRAVWILVWASRPDRSPTAMIPYCLRIDTKICSLRAVDLYPYILVNNIPLKGHCSSTVLWDFLFPLGLHFLICISIFSCSDPCSALKIYSVCSSETLLSAYRTIWR